MASPIKRICLHTSRQKVLYIRPQPWQQIRQISDTLVRPAAEHIPAPASDQQPDPTLDNLTRQPGVKYTVAEGDEDLQNLDTNNLSSLAHRELEQHKELREMTRLAAWEMPLLAQFAKPFEPPREEQVLRWRYTTYMGESHPAARKVVVEFKPDNLKELNESQRDKLLKVAGARYNPSTKTIKMSCESFETQAQNKRYLADTISKLIAECKDPNADSFADIPLDTRHHKPRKQYKFPESWILTPERKAELEQKRRTNMIEEGARVEQNRLVSGVAAIEEARKIDVKRTEEPVMVEARRSSPKGRR